MPKEKTGDPLSHSTAVATWPVFLWLSQGVVPIPILVVGANRLLNGPPLGAIMWPVWVMAILWTIMAVWVVARRTGRKWLDSYRYELLLVVVSTALSAALGGELAVRLLGNLDVDGNFSFRGHRLPPYKLPIARLEEALRIYENNPLTRVQHDEDLGWHPRPGSSSELSSFFEGIRIGNDATVFALEPVSGVQRIALFGDSFTHGAEVPFSDSWGALLEKNLESNGAEVEVLNFGGNGYGMDQALLRWKKDGTRFSPDVVIFGLQLENLDRNLNIIRTLYNPNTGLPFSKPRFTLTNGELKLLNHPAIPPADLIDRLRDIDSWNLLQYEGAYDPRQYVERAWHKSKLVTLLADLAQGTSDNGYDASTNDERMELGLAIMRAFHESVSAKDSRFLIVHLPKRSEIKAALSGDPQKQAGFLKSIESQHDYIETMPSMLEYLSESSLGSLFMEKGHYSANGNRVIARAIAKRLEE